MINIKNLTKVYETINYNVVALSNLNFSFVRGEVVVILGRSGSGKTTFLNVLGGFDNTYSGSYFLDQHEFKTMTEEQIDEVRSKRIGFVFQHQVLFNHLTVVENVEIALNVLGVTSDKKKRLNAMKALTLVGLRRHAYKYPWQLSGGEKQRVAIARALIKDPDVIICDEPTAALDSVTSKEILDLLANVCKNKLLVIATHNKSIVKNYGTRIIELRSGYVVRDELVKEDKSNIKVDEMDKLVDRELYEEEIIETSQANVLIQAEQNSQILRDLQLDLKSFTTRNEEVFFIDAKEKEKVVQKRREKYSGEESFESFDRVIETITNEKRYAFTSFIHKKRSYLFLAFFLFTFLLVMIVGFNSINEVFIKGDNTHYINYNHFKNNELIELNLDPIYDYETAAFQFVDNNQLYRVNDVAFDTIFNDPSFKFRYYQELFHDLQDYLNTNDYKNSYTLYYDREHVFVAEQNDEILFSNLKTKYVPYKLTNKIALTSVMKRSVDTPFNYLYIESNDQIAKYLIKDSKLPKRDNEVIISVETLMNLGIIGDVNSTNINDIYAKFKAIDESKKVLTINQVVMTGVNTETVVEQSFKIVGLYNAGDDLTSFYRYEEAPTFVFSKKASDRINIGVSDELNEIQLIPNYMEINKKVYQKLGLADFITAYKAEYLNKESKIVFSELQPKITIYQNAMLEIKNQMVANNSLNGKPFNDFLRTKEQDSGLRYLDLFDLIINGYLEHFTDQDIKNLCNSCTKSNYKSYAKNLIMTKDPNNVYPEFLNILGNEASLSNEQLVNRLIASSYFSKFNQTYLEGAEGNYLVYESGQVPNAYIRLEKDIIKLLSNVNIKEVKINNPEQIATFVVKNIGNSFVNPNYLMTSMTTVASSSVVVFIMYLMSYIIANLFGNIYHLFFLNRKREFGSLRILGAKFNDIKAIITLENKYLLRFSYLCIFITILIFELIGLLTSKTNLFMIYLYDNASRTFTNFSFLNLFKLNILTLINVLILMRVIFKKQLIDDNVNDKIKDMNTLKAITDWDGE